MPDFPGFLEDFTPEQRNRFVELFSTPVALVSMECTWPELWRTTRYTPYPAQLPAAPERPRGEFWPSGRSAVE